MNIVMEYGDKPDLISTQNWDFAFYGNEIDDRCKDAIEYSKTKSFCQILTIYHPETYQLVFDGSEIKECYEIADYLKEKGINEQSNVLLECTSLGVVEMLLLIQTIKDLQISHFDSLYLEPHKYLRRYENFSERHHFHLTKLFEGFLGIPQHYMAFETGDKAVVLCGFESERVGRVFEELDLQGPNCQLLFGMPPYTVGWDMNTYANHLPIIDRYRISTEFYYAGASNPLAVYEKLERVYNGLSEDQKLFILPFGTKPMSLGACIFKVLHDSNKLSVLYDHPDREKDRSKNVKKWNLYKVFL